MRTAKELTMMPLPNPAQSLRTALDERCLGPRRRLRTLLASDSPTRPPEISHQSAIV